MSLTRTVKTGPVTFFTNSITGIATWYVFCALDNCHAADDVYSYATPPMLLHLGLRSGFVYGSLSVPMCILMWLYLPETKA